MRIIIACGAFKHSLSATQATQKIAEGLAEALPDAHLVLLPIADGGNGTLDAWLAQGGERVTVTVHDPLMRPINASYGILADDKTAIIEMAQASGLELLTTAELNPLKASTYGTGELLLDAFNRGIRRFIIGVGGSATVDGGIGALTALGVRFLDGNQQPVSPDGAGLSEIIACDTSSLDRRWQECEIIIASDVQNPLVGEQGASAVFAPQKGASPEQVALLEAGLEHAFGVIAQVTGNDMRYRAGAGAAGGLSAGLLAFLGGTMQSGIDLLLKDYRFEEQLSETDWVITGEGQMDEQTVFGKAPFGVARLAKAHGVPTIALVGGLMADDRFLHQAGFQAVFPIMTHPMALTDAIGDAPQLLRRAALRIGYVLAIK